MRMTLALKRWWRLMRSTRASRFDTAPGSASVDLQQTPISGLEFYGVQAVLPSLRLQEPVWLVREPENHVDKNAIRVETLDGRHLGHINRDAARVLAKLMDAGTFFPAYVAGIEGGRFATKSALTIGVCTGGKAEKPVQLPSDDAPTAYFAESRPDCTYLAVNGRDGAIRNVVAALGTNGLKCTRPKPSTRLAPDGHMYDWFVEVTPPAALAAPPEDVIAKVFAERWDLHAKGDWERMSLIDALLQEEKEKVATKERATQEITELAEEYSRDVEQQRTAREEAERELTSARIRLQQMQDMKHRIERNNQTRVEMVRAVFPTFDFARRSLEAAVQELTDLLPLLRVLRDIDRETAAAPCKSRRVQGAKDWREFHFNTGTDTLGRLYYRTGDGKTEVLISRKGEQKTDVEFLSRQ